MRNDIIRSLSNRRVNSARNHSDAAGLPIGVIVEAQRIRNNLQSDLSPASKLHHHMHQPSDLPCSFDCNRSTSDSRYRVIEEAGQIDSENDTSGLLSTNKEQPGTSGCSSSSNSNSKLSSNADTRAPYNTIAHKLSFEEIESVYQTDVQTGLDQSFAASLLDIHGPNQVSPAPQPSSLIQWIHHCFLGTFNVILWLAIVTQLTMFFAFPDKSTDHLDLIVPIILSAVILSAGSFQWYQERQSQNTMQSFLSLAGQNRSVIAIRNGQKELIDAAQLVVGDLVSIKMGEKIPADLVIIQSSKDLMVDNSILTGETVPVSRHNQHTHENPMITENLLFYGTLLVKGNCLAIVHATGDRTLLGRITQLSTENEGGKSWQKQKKSTFQQEMDHFISIISYMALLIAVSCVIWDLVYNPGKSYHEIIYTAVLILIANIPEGLKPTVSGVLTLSANRLAKKKVLVRKLEAVEILGAVSVICSDKTGTLTQGNMTVKHFSLGCSDAKLYRYKPRYLTELIENKHCPISQALVRSCVLCNDSVFQQQDSDEDSFKVVGVPTENALLNAVLPVVGGRDGVSVMRTQWNKVFEIPFNSEHKWSLAVFEIPTHLRETKHFGHRYLCLIKGAPEKIVDFCQFTLQRKEITTVERSRILSSIADTAAKGERVLCFAQAYLDDESMKNNHQEFHGDTFENCNWTVDGVPGGLGRFSFIGFVGIIDPPRPGVQNAIEKCHQSGIRVVMVTGDHEVTAKSIGEKIGLSDSIVVSGQDIDFHKDDAEFWDGLLLSEDGRSSNSRQIIFARTNPLHKMIIVEEFQKRGEIVAVTGDGVNDSPALNKSDVGISMGISGTDVAKESSDLILMDDNFLSIIHGIEEGRLIFDNLKKSIAYTLCSKLPQLIPVLFANFFDFPLIMTILQVLLIDLFTDIWAGVFLGYQKKEDNLMKRPPRKKSEMMVNSKMIVYSYLHIGMLQSLACLLSFQYIIYNHGHGIDFGNLFGINSNHDQFHDPNLVYFCYETSDYDVQARRLLVDSDTVWSEMNKPEGNSAMNHVVHTTPETKKSGSLFCEFSEDIDPSRTFHHSLNFHTRHELLGTAQTAAYVSLILMQVAAALNCQTRTVSLLKYGLFSNPWLNVCLICEVLFGVAAVYTPAFQTWFDTRALPVYAWLSSAPFMIVMFLSEELRKYLGRSDPDSSSKRLLVW